MGFHDLVARRVSRDTLEVRGKQEQSICWTYLLKFLRDLLRFTWVEIRYYNDWDVENLGNLNKGGYRVLTSAIDNADAFSISINSHRVEYEWHSDPFRLTLNKEYPAREKHLASFGMYLC